ncbi:hypothetical protein QQS21_011043 [Conoideocrella luteorostrata]|uniref:Heterokaryon incompatibility domain-containing protein n=1 Tax=Conoideocrella luteorostrata TaxID=1105319 RepID=A0AAJ0CGK2_9HYPO|nr:hypothetical protein QQS21_011043 [Conoideocrella luteorostrata]
MEQSSQPSSSTKPDYRYSTLENSQIRILTLLAGGFDDPLTGELTHRQFVPSRSEVPKYEAISYAWGDQTDMEPGSCPASSEATKSALSFTKRDWLAIQKLFARPWFKRLWVRQEIILAKSSVVIFAGYSSTAWSRFGQAAGCIEVKIALGKTNSPILSRFVSDISNIVALYRTPLFKHPVALLNFTRSCQCKDERDRVYSILGLIRPSYKIYPNYRQNITDVCKEFMLKIYREDGRLDILSFCDVTAEPSWVPNISGPNPAHHFWRNFATGYSQAHLNSIRKDTIEVNGIEAGALSSLVGHIPKGCSENELKRRVKRILVKVLGWDPGSWEEEAAVSLTQTLLGGHWIENTNHRHDPQLRGAVSVLKNWVIEDVGRTYHENAFLDMLVTWAMINSLPGWSVYQATNKDFGICSSLCIPGDQIFVVFGCKDPVMLRKSEGFGYYRIVGPSYIYHLSCGQAVLGKHAVGLSFVNSFDNPDLIFEAENGLRDNLHVQCVDHPYKIEDDHPLWHRRKSATSSASSSIRADSSCLEVLRKRGIHIEQTLLK